MSIFESRGVLLFWALVFIGPGVTQAQVPPGWLVAGSSPQDYDFSLDSSIPPNGHSALIAARSGVALQGFGTLMQVISAENYRGQHVRLSGYLKTYEATRAQMWMRVDGPERKVLSFDNMDSRPITGTTDWKRYDVVLDVPTDSASIAFGFLLTRGGKVWGHDFGLEQVDASIPPTASASPQLPKEPVNMDFRESTPPTPTGSPGYNTYIADIYDVYRPAGYYFYRTPPERIRNPGTSDGQFLKDKYSLCGMGIRAETKTSTSATLRWDLKLSVVTDGSGRFASLAAGAFKLPENHDKPVPRRPITRLDVQMQGAEGPPTQARIRGTPNVENGVTGEFPEAYAEKLFDALDAGTPFTVNLTYDSGEHESVVMRTHGGTRSRFYHGTDAPAQRCLRALVPTSKEALKNPVLELQHPE
jgi:hypothetical protein